MRISLKKSQCLSQGAFSHTQVMSHLCYQKVWCCMLLDQQSPPSFSPQCLRDCKTLLAPPTSRPTHFRHLRNAQSADNQFDFQSLLAGGAKASWHTKHYDVFSKLPETPAISSRKAKSRHGRAARKICCDTKRLENHLRWKFPVWIACCHWTIHKGVTADKMYKSLTRISQKLTVLFACEELGCDGCSVRKSMMPFWNLSTVGGCCSFFLFWERFFHFWLDCVCLSCSMTERARGKKAAYSCGLHWPQLSTQNKCQTLCVCVCSFRGG